MKLPRGVLTALYKTFVDGPLRIVGKPIYKTIVPIELTVHRLLFSNQPIDVRSDLDLINRDLTAIVKTFERPETLGRLIASIKSKYPDLHIIVVDDSRHPQKVDGVETIILPYDQGVTVGRNEALSRVKTKYFLQLDDDFVFYRHTKLGKALSVFDNNPQIDIMGGDVVDLPFFTSVDYSKLRVFPTGARATMPTGSRIAGLPVYDIVAQYFLGRTDRVRLVGWDPNLKKLDHTDFFSRGKGVLTTVFNKELKILHARTPYDTPYMAIRTDDSIDRAVLLYRYEKQEGQLKSEDKDAS